MLPFLRQGIPDGEGLRAEDISSNDLLPREILQDSRERLRVDSTGEPPQLVEPHRAFEEVPHHYQAPLVPYLSGGLDRRAEHIIVRRGGRIVSIRMVSSNWHPLPRWHLSQQDISAILLPSAGSLPCP